MSVFVLYLFLTKKFFLCIIKKFCEKIRIYWKKVEVLNMLVILIRTIVLYTLVLLVMRGMGKREIGQLQPFELVISIMIADLASIPMSDIGVPIFNGIIPILGLLIMHLMISLGNLKSIKFRQAICGKPSILIFRGKIDEEVLIKERYTINELQERLRGKDVFNIGDVEYAILETSGEINVILKPEKRNPTLEDMELSAKYEGITYDLVIDGVIQYDNLNKLNKDYTWLEDEVSKFGFEPEDALIVTIDGNNNIFCLYSATCIPVSLFFISRISCI